jgi:hypothetical protein
MPRHVQLYAIRRHVTLSGHYEVVKSLKDSESSWSPIYIQPTGESPFSVVDFHGSTDM